MKYLILKNRYGRDNQFKQADYFPTVEDRDQFIEAMLGESLDELFQSIKKVHTLELDLDAGTVEVEWSGTLKDLRSRDTIIIKQSPKEDYEYFFIDKVVPMENNNMYQLEITNNYFLNYPGSLEGIKNIEITAGHLPITDYLNKSFDVGSYRVASKKELERNNTNIESTPFLFVFEKTNTETKKGVPNLDYVYDTETNKLKQPYGVKICPIKPIALNIEASESELVKNEGWSKGPVGGDGTGGYIKAGTSYDYVINDLPAEGTIRIEARFIKYIRSLVAPIWDDNDANSLTVDIKDIDDKWEYYLISSDQASSKWADASPKKEDYVIFSNNEEFGIGAAAERNAQIVKIKYDRIASTLKISDISKDEYNSRVNNQGYVELFKASNFINSDAGRWSKSSTTSQYAFMDKATEGDDYNQFQIARIVLEAGTTLYWDCNKLIDYVEDVEANANVINLKISNYNPLLLDDGFEFINDYGSIKNVDFIEYDGGVVGQLLEINRKKSEPYNTYSFNYKTTDWGADFDLLQGLKLKKLEIENLKIFDIETEHIDLETGLVEFTHETIPSPNEWEERIRWNIGVNFFTQDNIWDNEKEGFTPTNELAGYKASNPVQSKLDLLRGVVNPLTYLSPSRISSEVAQAGGQIISRQNMKRSPEEIKGSGAIYPDLVFNDYGSAFILTVIKPLGTDWIEEIQNLYKNGITLDSGKTVKDFSTIKRDRFNYIKVANYDEVASGKYGPEIVQKLSEIYADGIRLWHDHDKFNEYADAYDDNGDSF